MDTTPMVASITIPEHICIANSICPCAVKPLLISLHSSRIFFCRIVYIATKWTVFCLEYDSVIAKLYLFCVFVRFEKRTAQIKNLPIYLNIIKLYI